MTRSNTATGFERKSTKCATRTPNCTSTNSGVRHHVSVQTNVSLSLSLSLSQIVWAYDEQAIEHWLAKEALCESVVDQALLEQWPQTTDSA